jgi:hypothetical protein
MFRLLAPAAALLFVVSMATTARADGFWAESPALDAEQAAMTLALLGSYRASSESLLPSRVKLPQGTAAAEREQPGEALTTYVERVWSQARVYRRPGGAELILRAKF